MDASRHGPKKGGPIGPMGSTIGPFKYYIIYYQTIFKYFRAAGLPGQTARPGPIKSISGRAWAGTSAHGQARHGPLIFSCLSGSCLNGPCLAGPVPGRAGPPVWPPILGVRQCSRQRVARCAAGRRRSPRDAFLGLDLLRQSRSRPLSILVRDSEAAPLGIRGGGGLRWWLVIPAGRGSSPWDLLPELSTPTKPWLTQQGLAWDLNLLRG